MHPTLSARLAPHTKGIEPYRRLVGPQTWIASVNWSPDSKSISAASKRGLFVWDVATARLRFHVVSLRAHHAFGGVWSPDGDLIACATDDRYVRLFDSDNGRLAREFEVVPLRSRGEQSKRNPQGNDVRGVSWSPDGRYLVCGTDAGPVVLDTNKGAASEILKGATRVISALWSPDGEFIACTTYGSSAYVWSAQGGFLRYAFDSDYGPALAWSPDSRYLAFAGDRAVCIVDIRHDKMSHMIEGHLRPLGSRLHR